MQIIVNGPIGEALTLKLGSNILPVTSDNAHVGISNDVPRGKGWWLVDAQKLGAATAAEVAEIVWKLPREAAVNKAERDGILILADEATPMPDPVPAQA